jgi:hypothetical protein
MMKIPARGAILRPAHALLETVRRILALVVLAAAVAGAVAVLAFRGGPSQPQQPVVTGGDDANLMRALQRPKLVPKAP